MFKLGYTFDLGPDAMPVDLSAAGVTGKRVNLRNARNWNAVLIKGAASSGTDPVLTFNLWSASSGGSANNTFNPDHFWQKAGATLAGTESWTNVALTGNTNGQVTLTGEQGHQGIYVFEIHVPLLTAGFDWMSVDIAKAGTVAQLGTLIWVPADLSKRYGPANLDPTLY